MSSLSSRGLKASAYEGTASRERALEAGGRPLISLAVAQNALMDDLLLPRVEAAAARGSRCVRYASSWLGLPELRANVARLYNAQILRSGNCVLADEVAVTAGATSAIDALLFAVLDRGDAVLTPAPYYGSYARDVEARAECVLVPFASDGGAPTVEALEEFFQWREPRPKALLISSPHNPCGTVLGAQALRDVVSWTRLRGVHLVVDEVRAGARRARDVGQLQTAPLSVVSRSFRLIPRRATISRSGLEASMFRLLRARAEDPR